MQLLSLAAAAAAVLPLLIGAVPSPSPERGTPPSGTAVEADLAGTVAVLDATACTVTLTDRAGRVRAVTGGRGWGSDQLDAPAGIWARNGLDIFVADYGNHRIQRFDRGLTYVASFATRDADRAEERFGYPLDVALSRLGDLFILDGENSRVLKVNGFSAVERTFGGFDAGGGRLLRPRNLDVGPDDRVFVLDGNRVVRFDGFGNFLGSILPADADTIRALFADERGLVLAEGSRICWFDERDRRTGSLPVPGTADPDSTPVLGIAAARDSLYLLSGKGLVAIPDPRP